MITQDEFIGLVSKVRRNSENQWDIKELWRFVRNITQKTDHKSSFKFFLKLRIDMQKALAKYSKKHKFDVVQLNAIKIIEELAKWCGEQYKVWVRNEIIRSRPELVKNPRKIKSMANDMWEKYLRLNSY